MKDRLETIRENLQTQALFIEKAGKELWKKYPTGALFSDADDSRYDKICDAAMGNQKALALLDSLIAELDSPELVERVAKAICTQILVNQDEYPEHQPTDPTSEWYREDTNNPQQIWELNKREAQAAITAIKGITATRDRE